MRLRVRFKILPFDATSNRTFSWWSGQAKEVGTELPGPENISQHSVPGNHVKTKWLPGPPVALGYGILADVSFGPAYYWRCVPKQKKIDPGTLIYLNSNGKVAQASDIFASRFISAEFTFSFTEKNLSKRWGNRREELGDLDFFGL